MRETLASRREAVSSSTLRVVVEGDPEGRGKSFEGEGKRLSSVCKSSRASWGRGSAELGAILVRSSFKGSSLESLRKKVKRPCQREGAPWVRERRRAARGVADEEGEERADTSSLAVWASFPWSSVRGRAAWEGEELPLPGATSSSLG